MAVSELPGHVSQSTANGFLLQERDVEAVAAGELRTVIMLSLTATWRGQGEFWLLFLQRGDVYSLHISESTMKQFARPWLRCWALLGSMLPWAAAVKFTQESNLSISESATELAAAESSASQFATDVHNALADRSSRTSLGEYSNASDGSLDTVANGKAGAAIVSVGGTFSDWAAAVAHVGKKLGAAAGNTVSVVGNRVIRAPSMRWDQLDEELKGMAIDMGQGWLAVKHAKLGLYMSTFHAGYKLAAPIVPLAMEAMQKAMTVARKVGPIADAMDCIVGEALTDEKKCQVVFANQCDCGMENGVRKSYTIATAGAAGEPPTGLEMRCVPTNRLFGKGFRLKASIDSTGEVSSEVSPRGGVKLPGSEEEVTYQDYSKAKAVWTETDEKLRTTPTEARDQSIEDDMTDQPSGSCEGKLTAAVDAIVAFNPDNIFVKVSTTGTGDYVKTEAKVSGWVRASVEASVTGEGTCSYEAVTGFPKKPVKKMFCFKGGCIIFAMQMLATLKIEGTLTGSITQTYDVDFYVEGTAEINTGTIEESEVDAVVKNVRYKEGLKIAASATASVRVSVGPKFVVWPTPGLPLTFFPQAHAKAEASGSIQYYSRVQDATGLGSDIRQSRDGGGAQDHSVKAPLEMCAAAVLSIYMDMGITGFALPPPLDKMFDDLREMIQDAMLDSLNSNRQQGDPKGRCLPAGADTAVQKVADKAATVAATVIASLGLPLQLQLVELLSSDKLFCKEPWKSDGFDESPCAEQLGCSGSAGPDGLPEPGVVKQPASPTFTVLQPEGDAYQCKTHVTHLAFGDHFLEIGSFRIAEHDGGEWLSVTHKDNPNAIVLFNKGWQAANQDTNFLSLPRWKNEAWARPKGPEHVKGSIKMGFQFIQIGSFRFGADDFCLMVSHVDPATPGCLREWKFNHDIHGPSARTVRDRPEGPPTGISVGWAYLQIGKFRLGYTGGSVVILNAEGGMATNRLIEVWHSNGHLDVNNVAALDNEVDRRSFVSRPAHKFPCPQIGDMAFGPCDQSFGAWGDRFVQLGKFRLAAIDPNHFSVSHSDGWTAQIFRSDGTLHPGPRTDFNSWNRPIGFPHGVTFGRNFVQIGNFRLADMDGDHLTVSHISGNTAQIFRGDGHVFPGPTTGWNGWAGEFVAGPASGVRYGNRFLEIGNFRLGATDGSHLVVSKGHQTIRIFRGDGHIFGGVPGFGQALAEKPLQSHCGLIQSSTGTCPGITAGDGFLQFGDWRLVTHSDHLHFSISHREGQTALVLTVHGVVVNGPNTGWGGWHPYFEARHPHLLRFGDHFIELTQSFRIGSVRHLNKDYLTISSPHFHGGQFSILAFSREGVHTPLQFGGLFAGPHARVHGAPKGITFGDRFVQIGKFRIGDVDGKRFSVAHVGEDDNDGHLTSNNDKTIVVYKNDGSRVEEPTPAENEDIGDTTVGRPFAPCKVTEMH
eukprot:s5574_g4.t4